MYGELSWSCLLLMSFQMSEFRKVDHQHGPANYASVPECLRPKGTTCNPWGWPGLAWPHGIVGKIIITIIT